MGGVSMPAGCFGLPRVARGGGTAGPPRRRRGRKGSANFKVGLGRIESEGLNNGRELRREARHRETRVEAFWLA